MRHPSVKFTDFSYADEIDLISKNIEKSNILLQRVEEQYGRIGLNIYFKRQKHCISD